jgi:hypothetical protein
MPQLGYNRVIHAFLIQISIIESLQFLSIKIFIGIQWQYKLNLFLNHPNNALITDQIFKPFEPQCMPLALYVTVKYDIIVDILSECANVYDILMHVCTVYVHMAK